MGTLLPEDSTAEEAERAHLRLTWDHATAIGRLSDSVADLQSQVAAQDSALGDLQEQVRILFAQVGSLQEERVGFLRAIGVVPSQWARTSPWTLVHRVIQDLGGRVRHLWRLYGPRQPTLTPLDSLDP